MAVAAGMLLGNSASPLVRELFLPNHPFLGALTYTTLVVTGAVQSYKLANRLQPFYPIIEPLEEAQPAPLVALQNATQHEQPVAQAEEAIAAQAEPQGQEEEPALQEEQDTNPLETETVEQRRERLATAAVARQADTQ